MKFHILIIFLMNSFISFAQTGRDSSSISSNGYTKTNDSINLKEDSIYRYLVVRSYVFFKRSYIFKNDKRLKVRTTDGRVMRGRLHIISDSSFYLYNVSNGKVDTFLISDIEKINNVTLFRNIVTGFAEVTGIGLIGLGYSIRKDSNRDDIRFLGAFLMVMGGGTMLSGISISNGKPLPYYYYSYHLYSGTTKLRYRDLKKLYPR